MSKIDYDYTIWASTFIFGPFICFILDMNFFLLIGIIIGLYIISYIYKNYKNKKFDSKVRKKNGISRSKWNDIKDYEKDEFRRDYKSKISKRKNENLTRKAFNFSTKEWNTFSVEKKKEFNNIYSEQLYILKQVFYTTYYSGEALTPRQHKRIHNQIQADVVQINKELRKLSIEHRIKRIETYKKILEGNLTEWDKKNERRKAQKTNHVSKDNSEYTILKYAVIFLVVFTLYTCGSRKKIGAVCRDGTYSSSKGTGTCSHHKGVKNWRYKYWWE